MRLLIAGAGDLGAAVALQAVRHGHTVTALRRSAQSLPDCSCVQGDLQRPQTWLPESPEFDALLWCATPDQRDRDGYAAIYQHALLDLLQCWESRAALPQVLLTSSTAVYAEDGGTHDEFSTRFASSWNGAALLQAEQALLGRLPQARIARLGGIYGPGRTWLLRRVRATEAVQEQPPRWTNRIHVQDAAAAVLLLLERADAPSVCNVVDAACTPEHVVLDWLAEQMGLPKPPRRTGSELGKQVLPTALRHMGFVWQYPDFRSGYSPMLDPKLEN